MVDNREKVIHEVLGTMSPMIDSMKLSMLEGAIRCTLRGMKIEEECTELSTEFDNTDLVIDYFCASKKVEGCVDATIEQYKRTAQYFFRLINKGYKHIAKDDVKAFIAHRAALVSPNTVNNERRNLSSLFAWLHDEGYIEKNPTKGIKLREEDVELIYFTPQEEIAIRDTHCSIRDKAMIAFLFSTGVRVGELSAMNRADIDFNNNSVTFRGEKSRKGKFRTVYLDEYARRYIRMYLMTRLDENPALFVSSREYNGHPKRLSNAAIEKITKSITKKAGVQKKGTVHVFRKTFATRLAEKGCPMDVIQNLLGHADMSTTVKCYVAKIPRKNQEEWRRYTFVA